ncbi:unnamed protein product [Heterobilharzia americana]|nr:unnamed protein product [Heterobilharzia americana]
MLLIWIITLIVFSSQLILVNSNDIISHVDLNKQHSVEEKDSNTKVVYEATRSVCYAKGQAVECSPPFTNIAENAEIKATSTCGEFGQSEEVCSYTMGHRKCEVCDTGGKFGTHLLTDRHQMNNETCWISGSVQPGDTVNLTLSLGKRFEVYYISLQPCGQLPDSIALYKSSDFGVTWKPWQYFSTDCYRAFRLPTSNEHNAQISLANIQEVLCVALKSQESHDSLGQSSNVIAFSTTIGRPSTQPWSSALIDWMTMTDLRISLIQFPDYRDEIQHDSNGLFLNPSLLKPAKVFRVGGSGTNGGFGVNHILSETGTLDMSQHPYQSDMHYSKTPKNKVPVHFAFSDLSIGGQCKCNGHANRCVRDRIVETTPSVTNNNDKNKNGHIKSQWGPLRCDCQHNTEGTDCERCSPGYLDRPWGRGTSESANECKPHSVKSQSTKPEPNAKCPPCERSKKRIRFKKFCRCEAVFRGIVKSRAIHGNLMRLEVGIQNTWRITGTAEHLLPKTASPNLPAYRVWLQLKNNPADKRHGRCPCPNLQVGQSYLFITHSHQMPYGDRMELLLDTHSVILPWRESWRRRLMKFVRRAARESCDSEKVDLNEELKRTRRVQRLRLATDYYAPNNPIDQYNRMQNPSSYQSDKTKKINRPSASKIYNSRDASIYYPPDKHRAQHTAYHNMFSSSYSS